MSDQTPPAVEQWLRDNPPLTNAALRAMSARQSDRIAALESEAYKFRALIARACENVPHYYFSWHDDARKALEPRE